MKFVNKKIQPNQPNWLYFEVKKEEEEEAKWLKNENIFKFRI